MSKKKKNLAEELVDHKINEEAEVSYQPDDFDFDVDDLNVEVDEETAVKNSEKSRTVRLVHNSTQLPSIPQFENLPLAKDGEVPAEDKAPKNEVKVSYGLPAKQQAPRANYDGVLEGSGDLKNSEHLRIAQRKINELEDEVNQLRRENEDLASAGETFKTLNEEYYGEIDNLKSKLADQKTTFLQEIKLLKRIHQSKDKQINELKQQIDDYKSRIDNNFQRVRKREKDLEHRLEIAKMEEAAVVQSKDQLILDLKRRIDDVSHESDNFRKKSQENYKELQKKQQVVRGVIRALRIALTKLEGDDDSDFGVDVASGAEDDQ